MLELMKRGLVALVVTLSATAYAGVGPQPPATPASPHWRYMVTPLASVSFDVAPVPGVDVILRSSPAPRTVQVRESATLRVRATERVRLDVWGSEGPVDLLTWFAARFDKELDGREVLSDELVGVRAHRALRIARPPGCGVPARDIVVVQLPSAVAVVSVTDVADPDAAALFDALLATIDQLDGEATR